jgi:hypothetical protein
MSDKTRSRTERESWIEERLVGSDGRYRTTISDGVNKVEGRGNTAQEAEKIASGKWDARKKSACTHDFEPG